MTDGYWKKGDADPQKGVPFRHARTRAALLLSGADAWVMRTALTALILERPNEVLGALADAIEAEEKIIDAHRALAPEREAGNV